MRIRTAERLDVIMRARVTDSDASSKQASQPHVTFLPLLRAGSRQMCLIGRRRHRPVSLAGL